ncbi:hypothetical protein ACTQ1L_14770 [Agathobacter sp. LCP21S3_B2]|uniref:hypothetical protein n=1 Tax=Agathobacter sp. LCP21S3_B2 TaxID=3438734 RepID=UPI003F92C20E
MANDMNDSKVKKFIKFIYGSNNDMKFNIACSSLFNSVIMLAFCYVYREEKLLSLVLEYASVLFLVIWTLLAHGMKKTEIIIYELVRWLLFLFVLILSWYFLGRLHQKSTICACLFGVLGGIGVFVCNIFFISRFVDIFNFVKVLLDKIKRKVFNTDMQNTTGIKAALENITILLGTIGTLLVALKTIIEVVIQTIDII